MQELHQLRFIDMLAPVTQDRLKRGSSTGVLG
jgi:hypothetical protein